MSNIQQATNSSLNIKGNINLLKTTPEMTPIKTIKIESGRRLKKNTIHHSKQSKLNDEILNDSSSFHTIHSSNIEPKFGKKDIISNILLLIKLFTDEQNITKQVGPLFDQSIMNEYENVKERARNAISDYQDANEREINEMEKILDKRSYPETEEFYECLAFSGQAISFSEPVLSRGFIVDEGSQLKIENAQQSLKVEIVEEKVDNQFDLSRKSLNSKSGNPNNSINNDQHKSISNPMNNQMNNEQYQPAYKSVNNRMNNGQFQPISNFIPSNTTSSNFPLQFYNGLPNQPYPIQQQHMSYNYPYNYQMMPPFQQFYNYPN